MNRQRALAAGAMAVAVLVGASAFAESRPRQGTRSEGGRISRDRGTTRSTTGSTRSTTGREARGDRESTRSRGTDWPNRDAMRQRDVNTNRDRSTTERRREGTTERRNRDSNRERSGDRSYESFDERRYNSRGRESGENRRYDHNRSQQRYGGRPSYYHGRVSQFRRYGNGYRVWIGGAPYPFFVPLAHWDPFRFRVGVSIGLGGYYNSLGYYDYYDYYDGYSRGYRDGAYRDGRVYRTEELSGTVEDYDFRRRTALIRDDVTDRLVTVYMHSRDARLNHLRPGDYIRLEGGWKSGVFEAYRVFDVD